jgi:hypothetical protein
LAERCKIIVKLPHFLRKKMAAAMVSYRKGASNPEIDRSRLNHQRIALVKLDGIGDFVLSTTFLHLFRSQLPDADVMLFCRKPVGEMAMMSQFSFFSAALLSK